MKISSNHVFWALQLNYETRVLVFSSYGGDLLSNEMKLLTIGFL